MSPPSSPGKSTQQPERAQIDPSIGPSLSDFVLTSGEQPPADDDSQLGSSYSDFTLTSATDQLTLPSIPSASSGEPPVSTASDAEDYSGAEVQTSAALPVLDVTRPRSRKDFVLMNDADDHPFFVRCNANSSVFKMFEGVAENDHRPKKLSFDPLRYDATVKVDNERTQPIRSITAKRGGINGMIIFCVGRELLEEEPVEPVAATPVATPSIEPDAANAILSVPYQISEDKDRVAPPSEPSSNYGADIDYGQMEHAEPEIPSFLMDGAPVRDGTPALTSDEIDPPLDIQLASREVQLPGPAEREETSSLIDTDDSVHDEGTLPPAAEEVPVPAGESIVEREPENLQETNPVVSNASSIEKLMTLSPAPNKRPLVEIVGPELEKVLRNASELLPGAYTSPWTQPLRTWSTEFSGEFPCTESIATVFVNPDMVAQREELLHYLKKRASGSAGREFIEFLDHVKTSPDLA